MNILGNNLSQSPMGKLYTTVKNLIINPYANENEENINSPNKNIQSRKESSRRSAAKGNCSPKNNSSCSPILRRKPNQERRPQHLISNISYHSDSSDENDSVNSLQKNLCSIKGRTAISERNSKMTSSSDEGKLPLQKQDSMSTVKFDEEEDKNIRSNHSIRSEPSRSKMVNNSDNEVTTSSSSCSSSSEEEIDIAPTGQVQVIVKKRKSKNRILSSDSSDAMHIDTSNDFLSMDEETEKQSNKVDLELVNNASQELQNHNGSPETCNKVNNEEKIDKPDVEISEPSSSRDVGENSTVKENPVGEQKKYEEISCGGLLRNKKKKQLINKKKELTPCVIIDIIRRKNHPLNKYQHLFTHKTMKGLSKQELDVLKRVIIIHNQHKKKRDS